MKKKTKRSDFQNILRGIELETQKHYQEILAARSFSVINPGALYFCIIVKSKRYDIGLGDNLEVERATQWVCERHWLRSNLSFIDGGADDIALVRIDYEILDMPFYLLN